MSVARRATVTTLALVCVAALAPRAGASDLAALVEQARALGAPPPRFVESRRVGAGNDTLRSISFSLADPRRVALVTEDGSVLLSADGGATWAPHRLIVRRAAFRGSARASRGLSTTPLDMDAIYEDLAFMGFVHFDVRSLYRFPHGTTEDPYLDIALDSPALQEGPRLPWTPGLIVLPAFGRHEGRPDPGRETGAPRLLSWLLDRGERAATMSLSRHIADRLERSPLIGTVKFHPTDPDTLLVGSESGLWRTTDFGASWEHVHPGLQADERVTYAIAFDPARPDTVFIATGDGFRVSHDGGDTFHPIEHRFLKLMRGLHVAWSLSHPDVVYAGTYRGLFRSDDGGASWRWVYYSPQPEQSWVTRIAVHPTDPDRVVFSTNDGLYRTTDGGKTWTRAGALVFAMAYTKVVAHPSDGDRLACVTDEGLWETRDGGDTWQAVWVGQETWAPKSVRYDPGDPDVVWVVTANELLRVSSRPPTPLPLADATRWRDRVAAEPSLAASLDAAARALGVHPDDRAAAARKARWRHLVPQIYAQGGYLSVAADAALTRTYEGASAPLTFVYPREGTYAAPYVFLGLRWDLGGAVFSEDELPDRGARKTADDAYRSLRDALRRAYEERHRVLRALHAHPTLDPRTRWTLALRLEELTAELDAYTDGLWRAPFEWAVALRRGGGRP